MIHLTRLNNHDLMVNSDLIKFVESAPDTVITLINGEKIVVRETADYIAEQVIDFRRRVLAGLSLSAMASPLLPQLCPDPEQAEGEKHDNQES